MAKNKTVIQPRTLKGFRDFLPQLAMPREQLIEKARRVFRSYGFAPIDTPALEYSEILLGKGSDEADKQLYRFRDHGGRDVALRFDLTVPFARFAAQHIGQLGTPFKRYHIGPVWRGENTQHGRYREFYQCDFDTIGTDANAADIETALVIHDTLETMGFKRFVIHVNNRQILSGLLEQFGLEKQATGILRALDKLGKIGSDRVIMEMVRNTASTSEQAKAILAVATAEGTNEEILCRLEHRFASHDTASAGIANLRQLLDAFTVSGIPVQRLRINTAIARGLDYYTGTVFETLLEDLPAIGSICSGGRYDDLAGIYTRQHLSGVGASLGLDRLLAAMEELDMLDSSNCPATVLVVCFDANALGTYIAAARRLRGAGIHTECYPEAKAIGKQLKYADRRGIPIALIAGPQELERARWQVKDLRVGSIQETRDEALVDTVREMLL